nr:OB-fold nucleic acid binding domain-containing protein [Deinococcota bacterium]
MVTVAGSRVLVAELGRYVGQEVQLRGWVHSRRDLGGVQFLLLRDRSGVVQCVFHKTSVPIGESAVKVAGKVVAANKAPGGLELQASRLEVISPALEPAPIEIPKEDWHANPETLLEYRHVSLRGLKA